MLLVLGTAVSVQWIQTRYKKAIERSHLKKRCEDISIFEEFVPDRLIWLFIILGIIFTLINSFVVITIPTLYEIGGLSRVVRFVFIIPFGYVPILATGLAAYITIEVLIPRRLEQSEVSLDYFDPEKLGGMRPIGELVKTAYYAAMLGLIAYAVGIYAPSMLDGPLQYEEIPSPGRTANILFSVVWIVVVCMMIYGIYIMHRFMREEKRDDLVKLEKQMYNKFTIHSSIEKLELADPPDELEEYQEKAELIASTREYPAKFTMWAQLLIGVLLPKAIQMFLS